jgi:hypothetical protein
MSGVVYPMHTGHECISGKMHSTHPSPDKSSLYPLHSVHNFFYIFSMNFAPNQIIV